MKALQKILIAVVIGIGLSISVSAQKNDDNKKPKKAPPPVVNPAPKKGAPNKGKRTDSMIIWKEDQSNRT